MVLENAEEYHPEEFPGSEEQFLRFARMNWYPMSKFIEVRTDVPLMLTVSEVIYVG